MWKVRMGQSSNKVISNSEDALDDAVRQIEVFCKSSTEKAKGIGEEIKNIESSLKTFKSEKERLIKLQKLEYHKKKDMVTSSKATMHSVSIEPQTERVVDELSLSKRNETLQSKNDQLEYEISILKGQLKKINSDSPKSSLLTGVACNFLLYNKEEEEKYFPPGTDQQKEFQYIQNDNDILSRQILKLGQQLADARKEQTAAESELKEQKEIFERTRRKLDDQLKETAKNLNEKEKENIALIDKIEKQETNFRYLQGEMKEEANINQDASKKELQAKIKELNVLRQEFDQLESSITNLQNKNKNINVQNIEKVNQIEIQMRSLSDKDIKIKELKIQLKQLENDNEIEEKTIQTLRLEAEDFRCQLLQKNAEYSSEKRELDAAIGKVRNELMEVTRVKKELQKEVSQLEEEKTDMKLTIEQLQDDQETTDKNITEERKALQAKIIELQADEKSLTNQVASLQKENECLKTEKDRLEAKSKKKHISFHCVLKQPQSDQAVNGILDLLRAQYLDTDLETVEKSKRRKNTPLLVVLYNLSRIADDVKGALSGIEANSDVALVVLHSKEIKKPSEKILTEPDYRKLGIIVDISFLSAKGIISNDVTEKAVHQLVGFLNKF